MSEKYPSLFKNIPSLVFWDLRFLPRRAAKFWGIWRTGKISPLVFWDHRNKGGGNLRYPLMFPWSATVVTMWKTSSKRGEFPGNVCLYWVVFELQNATRWVLRPVSDEIDPESMHHKRICIKLTASGTCALLSVEVVTHTSVAQESTPNDWQRNRSQETPNARYAKCFTDSTLPCDSLEDSGWWSAHQIGSNSISNGEIFFEISSLQACNSPSNICGRPMKPRCHL